MIQRMLLSVREIETLPLVLLLGSVLALLLMERSMAAPVGLLLVAASIVEWVRRLRNLGKGEAGNSPGSPPGGPERGPNLMTMRWRRSFECGHPVIDLQHEELFNISNDLINAMLDHKPKTSIEYLLQELIEHIKDHFLSEEEVLARTGYPLRAEHREIHALLLERALALQGRYRQGLVPASELVGFIAYDVIAAHVVEEDLKFALRKR